MIVEFSTRFQRPTPKVVPPCFSLGFDKVTMYQFTINVRDISKFSARLSIIELVNGILGLPWLCKKVMKMRQFAGLDVA
jgi:hypothetical protein